MRTDLVAESVGPLRTRILARSSSLESAVGPSGTPPVAPTVKSNALEPAQPVPSTSSAGGPGAPNPDPSGGSVAHHPTPADSDDEDMDNAKEKHEQGVVTKSLNFFISTWMRKEMLFA